MLTPSKVYENHLWYPIVVKTDGVSQIVEMQGKEVNEWNTPSN